MRIVKFRVYNDLLKNYLPDDSVCILPNGDIVLYNLAAMIAAYKRPSDMLEGENTVEQFTGLKDKNDKEIYEGDILALYHRDGSIVNLCQVFWNELDNEYDWKPVGEDSWSDLFSAFYDDYKVVGNVHECTFN